MLNSGNNYLSTLIDAGADAFGHLYLMKFNFGSNSPVKAEATLAESLMVRCKGFTPPTTKNTGAYDKKFVTAYFKNPGSTTEVTRNFSTIFRVDANYTVYKALLDQQKLTFNPAKSFASGDIQALAKANKLFNVSVYAISDAESSNEKFMFKFENCWIKKIDPLKFEQGGSGPIEVSIEFGFLTMYDYLHPEN